jgi:HAD superfamily hydrolase (TIGR01509 family)
MPPRKPIYAIIFDIDGTLVDSVDFHARAWQEAFRRFGRDVPYEDLRHQIGKGGDQLMPVFFSEEELDSFGEEMSDFRKKLFREKYLPLVRGFSGVRELFQKLRSDGRRIVLASSSPEEDLQKYIEIARIGDLIEEQTSAGDVDRTKPHPDIFEAALGKLGDPDPAGVLVVGDTPYDVEAARKAGLRTIGVLCGGFPEAELRRAGALAVFRGPGDLFARYDESPFETGAAPGSRTRAAEPPPARAPSPRRPARETAPEGRVRYAVVGLGWIAQAAMLPAFANAGENSELAALVSDDPRKLEELGDRYDVELRYPYDEFDRCLDSGKVDAVYIGLPNSLHRDYAERAARAGVHVLCEKPMAATARECEAMIRAADENDVRLMVAYRLHFEEANMTAAEAVASGRLGDPRVFHSVFTQQVEEGDIRLQKALGGGPLGDIGIYCINAARYLFRAEPVEAFAVPGNNGERRFREVPEAVSAVLRFPEDRLATFTCSFGAANVSAYRVVGTRGDLRMDPGYGFEAPLRSFLTLDGEAEERTFPRRDQFAAQLLDFSDCVLKGERPEPSGEEGLTDLRIIEALQRSMETGQAVPLDLPPREQRPSRGQVISPPAPEQPDLVHASDPSGKSRD